MPRSKDQLYSMPVNVADIVRIVCADYGRRERDIRKQAREEAVIANYTEMNSVIDSALCGVEEGIRSNLLDDIGAGRGYDFSPLSPLMSKNTYYKRKTQVVKDIAHGLALI
jgi:hypothetical protein